RKEAIDRMQKCKIIALETTGFNFVDVEYAKSRGIAVTNVSGYCTQEVADHTLALILSLERRFPYLRRRIEEDYAW
ncbi:C-terminal binding protein, partial [Intestinimonas butyriciproducens]|nr:C-terminal binding protein [Intestinimonas butyriciproducens]